VRSTMTEGAALTVQTFAPAPPSRAIARATSPSRGRTGALPVFAVSGRKRRERDDHGEQSQNSFHSITQGRFSPGTVIPLCRASAIAGR
jgi:hypothetical protein